MSNPNNALTTEEREAEFSFWLEQHKITNQRLAKILGVSEQFVRIMSRSETIPQKRRDQLIALGVPEKCIQPVHVKEAVFS